MRLVALVLSILAMGSIDALAHRTDRPRDLSGIAITSITHGEMAIIDRHVPFVAFFLLFWLWIFLAWAKRHLPV